MVTIEIILNGEAKVIKTHTTMIELIKDLELVPERLAVEYNLKILKRNRWNDICLAEGDQIEIVQLVGGGWESEKLLSIRKIRIGV